MREKQNTLLDIQKPPAEKLYSEELERLKKRDETKPKPPGWNLSPQAVIDFVLGDVNSGVSPKFVGERNFIECCIVALATNRGLMLIGEPGTAKSYLSELLAAAISGDSALTIQGSAGTTEDQIRYSWNYALMLSEGPSEKSLVPAPIYEGMKLGKIVRFEELSRCPGEIQDTLLSILSDRVLHIPELNGEENVLFAKQGFNIIATSNTRDRGTNEMSSALKRRFNFETVTPISSISEEQALVEREMERLLKQANVPAKLPQDLTEVLVTCFHELRNSKTISGKALEPLSSTLSTAEAVSVGFSAVLHAYYYDEGKVNAGHIVSNMLGSGVKDSIEDLKKIRHYFDQVAAYRNEHAWPEFYQSRKLLDRNS
ncbi:AAA family ATPase [Leptospira interrogans serovar Szwajizak]|uniref:ATP-binding protein n=1 Tax=Leptospira interrogans TaxID=173 RepID=UPI000347AAED|nr:AAA family ATPase [Leptospira interrogans]